MLNDKIFAVAHYADQAVLWLLLFISVVSVGMILERFFTLRRLSYESGKVRSRLRLLISTQAWQDVEDLSRDVETLEGRFASYAMKHLKENGSKGLEELYHSFVLSEKPELEKFLGFLATVGSNAPYIGLFGTVLGIMKAFHDLSQATDAGQQTVMAGISMALVATATGLLVAIPAVGFYNYYQRLVKGILQNLESLKEVCMAYAKKKGI